MEWTQYCLKNIILIFFMWGSKSYEKLEIEEFLRVM